MNRIITGLLAAMTTAGFVTAAEGPLAGGGGHAKEPVQRVKITMVQTTDTAGKLSYGLLESAALTQLQQEVRLEDRLHDRALTLTEKEWRGDDFTKTKRFPRGAIQKRTVRVLQTYASKESADAALSRKEDDVRREEDRRAESEKKREANRRNTPNAAQKNNKSTADAERTILESRARDMYATKMKELKDAAAKPAEAAKNPPAGAEAPREGVQH